MASSVHATVQPTDSILYRQASDRVGRGVIALLVGYVVVVATASAIGVGVGVGLVACVVLHASGVGRRLFLFVATESFPPAMPHEMEAYRALRTVTCDKRILIGAVIAWRPGMETAQSWHSVSIGKHAMDHLKLLGGAREPVVWALLAGLVKVGGRGGEHERSVKRRLLLFLEAGGVYLWDSPRWIVSPRWIGDPVTDVEWAAIGTWPFANVEDLLKAERTCGPRVDAFEKFWDASQG